MRVLIPPPDHDFDITEVAVPWRPRRDAGPKVVFATERGSAPAADPLLPTGVIFGQLGAEPEARDCHAPGDAYLFGHGFIALLGSPDGRRNA